MSIAFTKLNALGVFIGLAGCLIGAKAPKEDPLPGMPPVMNSADIYSEDHAGKLSPAVRDFPSRVYVPNSGSNTVDIIDPKTYRIIGHFPVGRQPQHVVPSYVLKT